MMPTCREVSRVIAADEVQHLPRSRRWLVVLHLSMCGRCARFARELRRIGEAARSLWSLQREDQEIAERLERALSVSIEESRRQERRGD